MLKILKNQGFASIVEIVVTSVIFIITVFGILSAVSSIRPISKESVNNLKTYYAAESAYQPLLAQVRADDWDDGPLAPDIVRTQTSLSIDGGPTLQFNYTVNYLLTNVAGYPLGEAPRLLTMNILVDQQ